MRDEPAALGCSAVRSPLRPTPWIIPLFLSFTRRLYTLPSLSPTPCRPDRSIWTDMNKKNTGANHQAMFCGGR
eukprot:1707674-Rhodomonas_salina.6